MCLFVLAFVISQALATEFTKEQIHDIEKDWRDLFHELGKQMTTTPETIIQQAGELLDKIEKPFEKVAKEVGDEFESWYDWSSNAYSSIKKHLMEILTVIGVFIFLILCVALICRCRHKSEIRRILRNAVREEMEMATRNAAQPLIPKVDANVHPETRPNPLVPASK